MPNKNYQRGRRLEWQVVKDLKADGWHAMRTAGSHGFADVIAYKGGIVKFIQCKAIAASSSGFVKVPKALITKVKASLPEINRTEYTKFELYVKVTGSSEYHICEL